MPSGKNNPTAPGLSMRSKIVCLAIFGLVTTGVAMFSHRIRHTAPVAEECVAIAAVRGVVAPENRASFHADALAAAIVSKEHLSQLSLPGLPDAAELSGHVRASVLPLSPSGETTLTIACSQPSADKAAAVANGLVRHYAQQADQAWRMGAENAYRAARGDVQAKQQALLAAHQALEQRLEQPQPRERVAARPIVPAPTAAPAITQPNTGLPPSLVVQRKIDGLVARRAELLRTLTEVHPAVRDLDFQIERSRAELASLSGGTPRLSEAPMLAAPESQVPPRELPADSPIVSVREPSDLLKCKAAVEQAEQAVAAAFSRERMTWSALQNRPPITVQLAEPLQAGPQSPPPLRAILMPIAAGLAAALLAFRYFEARSHAPRIRTRRELERAAAVPVLGTVTIA